MKRKETYRCPDGKITTSANRYVREWRRMSKIMERGLNLKPIGYDPDFLMRAEINGNYTGTVEIPMWFAERLCDLITGVDNGKTKRV